MLTKDHFDRVVALLLPEMGGAGARKSLVESALFGCAVLQKIQWEGAARPFTAQLVRLLDEYGDVAPGTPAILALLEEVKPQVGADRQRKVDELVTLLRARNTQPVTSHEETLPTPPGAETVKIAESPLLEPRTLPEPAATSGRSPEGDSAPRISKIATHPTITTPRWPRTQPFRPRILVMKGGGVKGIAYVGALRVLEEHGYHFDHFVGTSAGAISAALLAVGYSSKELGEILETTNFKKFKDGWLLPSLLLLPIRKGLYRGEAFRVWLEGHLRVKFPAYDRIFPIEFKHLNEPNSARGRLTVFASCEGRTAYAFDSDDPKDSEREISFACRCSMAIPYFFMPERIDGKWVVDGGMQNNYPIDAILKYFPSLRDSSGFIGLYLGPKDARRNRRWIMLDLFSIWSESGDEEAKKEFFDRTIVIDPRPVRTTDFSLSSNDVTFLLAEGRASALHWLHYWSDDKKGQLLNEVEEARRVSDKLRALVIGERWRKLRPKLALALLLLVLLVTGLVLKQLL